ncbi:hypothetical protein Y1Q_0009603 [Alligator mississippiensis]|uniref:Uncharacterized protein n=1 Tax=Alligator mississippiensis TaxID=8496 RepID=A0A151NUP5_ALLMI|nr:hypothetical protein Y1Q_0009603 [Alligator mississippiensis]
MKHWPESCPFENQAHCVFSLAARQEFTFLPDLRLPAPPTQPSYLTAPCYHKPHGAKTAPCLRRERRLALLKGTS